MTLPRYDPLNRYEALVRAGESLLAEGGYEEAHPLRIAKLAGVSVGLFYRHFGNKRALLTAVVSRHLDTLHGQITREVERCEEPMTAFRQLLLATLVYFRAHQGLIRLFFMEIGYGDEAATAQLRDVRQNYRAILSTILHSGIRQGVFFDEATLDIDIAINSIVGTINWTLYDLLVVRGEDIEPEAVTERLSSHLLRSLVRPDLLTFKQ